MPYSTRGVPCNIASHPGRQWAKTQAIRLKQLAGQNGQMAYKWFTILNTHKRDTFTRAHNKSIDQKSSAQFGLLSHWTNSLKGGWGGDSCVRWSDRFPRETGCCLFIGELEEVCLSLKDPLGLLLVPLPYLGKKVPRPLRAQFLQE